MPHPTFRRGCVNTDIITEFLQAQITNYYFNQKILISNLYWKTDMKLEFNGLNYTYITTNGS